MLIGNTPRKPSLSQVRRIKRALRDTLQLSDDAVLTVTQLACLEEACAPLETVVGLLRPGYPQLQHKVHKATDDVDASDLLLVCHAWGFCITMKSLAPYFVAED